MRFPVCCHLTGDTKGSSLVSHHLKELRVAGPIEMKRSGRKIHCRIYSERLSALLRYLEELAATAEPKPLETSDKISV